MATQHGRRNNVGLAKEGTRLTAETTAGSWIKPNEFTLQFTNNYAEDRAAHGVIQGLQEEHIVNTMAEGTLSAPLTNDFIGDALFYLWGVAPSSVQEGATGAYKHTYDATVPHEPQTATLFYQTGDTSGNGSVDWLKTSGVLFDTLTIDSTPDDIPTFSCDIKGVQEQSSTSQTPSYSATSATFLHRHLTLGFADTVAGLSSPTSLNARSLSLEISKDSEAELTNNQYPTNMYGKELNATLNFTATVGQADFDSFAKANTKKAFEIKWENTNDELDGSGLYSQVKFTIAPSTIQINYSKNIGEIVTMDVTVNASWSYTDGFNIQPYVQNLTTSY